MTSSETIRNIILEGNPGKLKSLFEFDDGDSDEKVLKKFELFSRSQYPRYFQYKDSPDHHEAGLNYVKSYRGIDVAEVAYRGFGKTSLLKLFLTYILQNDTSMKKRYIKILTKDGKNSKQIVTDVYNLMLETEYIYGDMFEKDGEKKREETMGSFTMATGVKVASGTVGQTQRGHVQDAYRPDWIWFDDIEDRDSISSAVVTKGVIDKIGEALDGLSKDGNHVMTANYISDAGSVQWLMDRTEIVHIVPIMRGDEPTWDIYTKDDIKRIQAKSKDFYGEYMCNPLKSHDKFFNLDRIQKDLEAATEPARTSGGVKYWADYQPHHYYGQGSDHSEGIGLDSNALVGFDFKTGELTYTYASNTISPDLAAHEFARVGAEFGNCIYAPEVNNKCGGIVITTLKDINYPSIYRHVVTDKVNEMISNKLGWETTRKTKYTMFQDFKRDYQDGLIKIYDKDLLNEMKYYSNTDLVDETVSLVTRHFDLLTAAVIAWQMRNFVIIDDTEQWSETKEFNSFI